MRYRRLGASGLTVSEIGFGAWGIGGLTAGQTSYGRTDDARSRAALAGAFAAGITFYDTAPAYGDGHSEELIGEAFVSIRTQVIIATKAGLDHFAAAPDFSPKAIRRSLEGSLRRLRTDYVDLLQLHNPAPALFASRPESYGALEDLVREGKARAFGVSVKSATDAVTILAGHYVPSVQVNLNMLDVRAVEVGLLALADTRGVGVIARTPLCFGFLSGAVTAATSFPEGDHRHLWSRAQVDRWAEGARTTYAAAGAPDSQTMTQVALRFPLSFGAVSSTIPGILSPDEVAENAMASDFGPLPEDARDRVVALHKVTDWFLRA